jgi:hypothetical protein
LVLLLAAVAVASASVPVTFANGNVLQAADLNSDFKDLDQRLAALEAAADAGAAKEPFAGTYPGVLGSGISGPGNGATTFLYACGTAPAAISVSSSPPLPDAGWGASSAFGSVFFTNGGAIDINLGPPPETCTSSSTPMDMCAPPLTFFLKSPVAQSITVTAWLDNDGAIYVDGVAKLSNLSGNLVNSIPIPAGPFALSFLACSNNGPSLVLTINDAFITNPAYALTVDFDRTFHRNGN